MSATTDTISKPKGGWWALSPLAVFLCLYLVTSLLVNDFYKVPITVAFLASSCYAIAITRGLNLEQRIYQFSVGASNKNIMLMVWIFILAGAFAQSAKQMGAIDATVNLTLHILPDNLLLAGIMVGSLFSAGTSYIKLVADPSNQLPQIIYWLMGSLSGTRMKTVGFAAVCMAVGLLPLLLLRWRMNLLTLSADEARSMGVNTDRLRLVVILSATVLTAASVSVSGMIGWVGLVIPHLSRRLVGNDCRYLLPMSMVFGAAFLLLVDNLARCLTAVEIPIGILTAFVGAPFFVYLMIKGDDRL